jgi:hypothetical protein
VRQFRALAVRSGGRPAGPSRRADQADGTAGQWSQRSAQATHTHHGGHAGYHWQDQLSSCLDLADGSLTLGDLFDDAIRLSETQLTVLSRCEAAMTDPRKLRFVFTLITYAGHQIDGRAAEAFARALRQMTCSRWPGCKFRLLQSPYPDAPDARGGQRPDAALMASLGGTAATKAMGTGSTRHRHLLQTEVQRCPRRGGSCHRRGRERGGRQGPARPGQGPPDRSDPAEVPAQAGRARRVTDVRVDRFSRPAAARRRRLAGSGGERACVRQEPGRG